MFLAALPDNIRAEVIADHRRMERLRRQNEAAAAGAPAPADTGAPGPSNEGAGTGVVGNLTDVAPEFLAALPQEIQEEVGTDPRV